MLGRIVLTGRNSALVEAEISFTLAGECTKCLSQTEKSFAVSMAEEFSSDGAEGAYEYRSDKVDLTKAVDDKLILEMPMSFGLQRRLQRHRNLRFKRNTIKEV